MASLRKPGSATARPFALPKAAPGVLPDRDMAMDAVPQITGAASWAGGYYNAAFTEGLEFLGYPYLAELSQRPEYRRIVETIATEMTRKWVRIEYRGEEDKTDEIGKIEAEMVRLGVQDAFRKVAEQDGFFGRAHLYLDTGDTDDPDELKMPIGDGADALSKKKIKKGSLVGLRPVEAVWTYPLGYNSDDPLKPTWYSPDVWFVMGKQVHGSRLLTFVGREVPDLLKPAYSFGGLSMTQMAKPYVDNWLQTRQSVNDIVQSFSTFVLSTDMSEMMQVGGEELFRRADIFNNLRNSRGLMMLDKNSEEFANVAAPLTSLDLLQAQSQEHMAAVSGIPLVKLLGITPSGLNASTDGEIRSFYDYIAAYQKKFFGTHLTTVVRMIQLSLFGSVDEDYVVEYEKLWALDEVQAATVKKTEAETATIYIDGGVISPEEERRRLADEPDSDYAGLDPDELPEPPEQELPDDLLGGEEDDDAPEDAQRATSAGTKKAA